MINNNLEELYDNAIEAWRRNRCKGTAIIPAPIDDMLFVAKIINKVYERSPTYRTTIVVNNFHERQILLDYLNNVSNDQQYAAIQIGLKNQAIKILTYDFVVNKSNGFIPQLLITYHIDLIFNNIKEIYTKALCKLFIFRTIISDFTTRDFVYDLAPLIETFKLNELNEMRLQTPVEETQIGILIDEDTEDSKLLNYYDQYISDSLNIFGSFDNLEIARTGNASLGLSSTQFCYNLASENGWSPNLDMSIEFNRQIDEYYNPSQIADRAKQTYEIIRKRKNLLASNKLKLEMIYSLVNENKDKKILIINKQAEFANEVTDYINNNSEFPIAVGYHDHLKTTYMNDINGNIITYKSGDKKGQPKPFAAKAQMSNNQIAFIEGKVNVIVTNSAPNKELAIDVDVIIITSPQCESIKSYLYRLGNINVKSILTLYTLFIENSLEERLLVNKELTEHQVIVKTIKNSPNNENITRFSVGD